jgi:hypothetical protein
MSRKVSLSGSTTPLVLVISDQDISQQVTLTSEGADLQTVGGKTTVTLNPGKPVTVSYRWK